MTEKPRFGEILVEQGHLSQDQLAQALNEQTREPGTPLGQICMDLGFLSAEELQLYLHRYGKRLPLGDMLVANGLLTPAQLGEALSMQQRGGGKLGEILIRERMVNEKAFYAVLTRQYNLPFVPVGTIDPNPELRQFINAQYAAQHGVLPIAMASGVITVALSDPTRQRALSEIAAMTGFRVHAVLAPPSEIESAFMRLYGMSTLHALLDREGARARHEAARRPQNETGANARPTARGPEAKGFVSDPDLLRRDLSPWSPNATPGFDPSLLPGTRLIEPTELGAVPPSLPFNSTSPAPLAGAGASLGGADAHEFEAVASWGEESGVEVIEEELNVAPRSRYSQNEDSPAVQNVVQAIIRKALSMRASDIHLEPSTSGPRLRLRVDGVLQQHELGAMHDGFRTMYRSIVSRIKILSQLDITERRRPQDGSFRMMARSKENLSAVDFRVSTMPTRFGEGIVIRVLEQQRAPRSLESLGLSGEVLEEFNDLVQRPTGIILITGPTGSGKSSTLYAALRTIYEPGIKILTAEDPIEYTHPGIIQAEVNGTIGNSFARYLRSFLRQDPDVIMVGEIRDAETAEMAMRAAQTGHLLLSTLHTNDSTSSVQRLLDLDMEPNSISSALIGVMAQRLVRRICDHCAESYAPERYMLEEWFPSVPDGLTLKRGRGCEACNGTGFSGRVAVAELWAPGAQEILLINKRAASDEIRAQALKRMRGLGEDALRRALAGETTLEEAFRIVPYGDVMHTRENRALTLLRESAAESAA
ncbi:MAG: type II/IV secretion system protein [Candidatus Eisenbacteria bacterium]|nr:type II/IV secretion system protein [Candidatus Eisenbacteria bacterium]